MGTKWRKVTKGKSKKTHIYNAKNSMNSLPRKPNALKKEICFPLPALIYFFFFFTLADQNSYLSSKPRDEETKEPEPQLGKRM